MTTNFTKTKMKKKSSILMKFFSLLFVSLIGFTNSNAQVNTSFAFTTAAAPWTGFTQYTGATACGGVGGAVRANLYSGAPSATLSTGTTSLGTSLGNPISLSYDYKIADWSANTTGTATTFGSFVVQWASSSAGPWTTIQTVNATNHVVSGTCAAKTATFTAPAGPVFVRYVATWGAGDYYLNFDNISLLEILPPCSGLPNTAIMPATKNFCGSIVSPIVATGLSGGAGISFQWQESAVSGGPFTNVTTGTGATTSTYTPAVHPVGTAYYRLVTTCSNSSLSSTSAQIIVNTNIIPNVSVTSSSTTYCLPSATPVVLTAASTDATLPTFTWSAGTLPTTGSVVNVSPTATTIYTVTATGAGGCTSLSTKTVTKIDAPIIVSTIASPTSVCANSTSSLSVNAIYSILISQYTFASSVGTFTPITGGTSLALDALDFGTSPATNIGFTFFYHGAPFTQFVASADGFITFGATASSFGSSGTNTINFFGRDARSGPTTYQLSGSAPNRVLTIQYLSFDVQWNSAIDTLDAQIKLHEGTNIIDIVYGSSNRTVAYTGYVGLNGNPSTDFNNRTTTTDWAATTAGASAASMSWSTTVYPVSGLTYVFTPPNPPLTYAWEPSSDFTFGNATSTSVASPFTSVIYTVTVSSPNGCSNTGTAAVSVAGGGGPFTQNVVASTPANGTICVGKPFTIRDTVLNGGAPYTWAVFDPSSTQINPTATTPNDYFSYTFNPTVSGTYSVVVSDGCNNTSTETFSVVINSLPIVIASATSTLVCSAPALATASGAVTYAWLPGVLTGASISSTILGNTTFTVTGTDANGCTATATTTVNYGTLPIITGFGSSANAVCASNTGVTLTANASAIISGPQLAPTGYCVSALHGSSSNCINQVQLGSFTSTAIGTCALPSYTTWPTTPIQNVTTGSTFTLNISTTAATSYVMAWIDYNRNGVFNSTDEYITPATLTAIKPIVSATYPSAFVPIVFTVPATASVGQTVLRIRTRTFDPGATSACDSYGSGETEDYLLNIQSGSDPITSTLWTSSIPATLPTTPIGSPISTTALTSTTSYTFTATTAAGCINSSSVSVSVGAPLVCSPITSSLSTTFCAGLSSTLSAVTVGGGAPFTYAWSNAAGALGTAATQAATASGNYTVIVTDACGQSCSTNISITVNPLPVVTTSASAISLCTSGATSTINNSGAVTYITNPGALSGASNTFTPTLSTNYTVIGTDANGCSSNSSVFVGVGVAPVFVASGTNANPASICTGNTSVLSASATEIVSGSVVAPTGYAASAATNTGDEEIYSVSINGAVATPSANAGFNSCSVAAPGAGSIASRYSNFTTIGSIATVVSGSTYPWSVDEDECELPANTYFQFGTAVFADWNRDGDFADAGETIFQEPSTLIGPRIVSGTFTVPATVTAGVTRIRFIVAEGVSGAALIPTLSYGYGETEDYLINVLAKVPVASSGFSWAATSNLTTSTGNPVTTASLSATTTFTATASSSVGCTSTSTLSVNVGAAFSCGAITASIPTTFCANLSNVLTAAPIGGGGPYTYQWSNAAGALGTAATQSVNASGDYSVTITDACLQTCSTNILITVNPLPVVTAATSNTLVCGSASATLTGTGAVTYAWNPGALTGASVSVSPTANTNYIVTGTDANGCVSTASVSLSYGVNPIFASTSATPNTVCVGGSTVLKANANVIPVYAASGATLIGDEEIFSISINSIVATPAANLGSNSCSAIAPGPGSVLSGYSNFTTIGSVATVNPGATYPWSVSENECDVPANTFYAFGTGVYADWNHDGDFVDAGEKIFEEATTLAGPRVITGSFTVPATANGGNTRIRFVVNEGASSAGPFSFLSPTGTFSYGETEDYIINVNSAVGIPSYVWAPIAGISSIGADSAITNALSAATIYTVSTTNAAGCTATSSVTVAVATPVVTALAAPAAIQLGNSSTITASGAATYAWATNPTLSAVTGSPVTATPTAIGTETYTVVGTDANGCTASASATLVTSPAVSISLSTNNVSCLGDPSGSIDVTPSGFTGTLTYSISPNAGLYGQIPFTYSGLPAGTYTVSVTDGVSTATASTIITEPATLVTATITSVGALCNGGTGSLIAIGANGTKFGVGYDYLYSWTNSAQQIVSADSNAILPNGVYTLTVEDGNSCLYFTTATINNPPAVAVSASAVQPLCFGNTGSVILTTSGGTGTISTSPASTGLATGTYTFIATDANSCSSSVTATIDAAPSAVTITAAATQPLCAGETGSVTLTTSGGTGTITTTGATSGLMAGTYTFTATDANNCSASATATINAAPSAVSLMATAIQPLCNGQLGSVTLAASGGTGTISTTGSTSALTAGVYTFTATDANNCSASATATINAAPSSVTITAAATQPACAGNTGSVTLTTGGGTGTISTTGATTGLIAGTYTFTATDANNCSASATATINAAPSAVSLMATTIQPLCAGETGSVTLTTGGGTGTISTTGASTGLMAGTYTFTATDANNCSASATAIINAAPSAVTITAAAAQPACAGNTGSVTLTTSGGTGTISTTGATTGLMAGTYTFTATDANNCSASATATINAAPNAVTITAAATQPACAGNTGSVTLTTGGGIGTISTTGATTGLMAGTYTFTATDANNCSASATVTINAAPSAVTITAAATQPACAGNTGSVTLTTSGGTGTITTTGATSGLMAGTYTFTATDANNCSASATATINAAPSAVSLMATAIQPLCNGQLGSVTLAASGGTGTISTTGSTSALTAGVYTFTATDANNCSASATATINAAPSSVTITAAATQPACAGNTGSVTLTTGGGTGTISTTGATTGLMAGTYTFTATDANGCSASATAIINAAPSAVTITAAATQPACAGNTGSVTLTTGGGTGTISTTGATTGLMAGTYTFTATDANNCSASATATINTAPSAVSLMATAIQPLCNGQLGSVTLAASGGTGIISTTGSTTALTAGVYTFTATDANNCSASATATINAAPSAVTITAAATQPACAGNTGSVTLTTGGGTGTISTTGATTGLMAGTYTFTATDANGCSNTATATINAAPSAIIFTAVPGTILVSGGTTNVTLTASGGTGTITTSGPTTGLVAGTYTFTATDANGCTKTVTATIAPAPGSLFVNAVAGTIACNGGTTNVTLTTGGGIGTLSTSPASTGLMAGTYTFTVTDANSITATTVVTIAAAPSMVTITAASTQPLCNGQTGSVVLTTGGGTGTIATTGTTTGLMAGTYTFTATDANGCSKTATATINAAPSMVMISATATQPICNGGTGSVALTTSGGTGSISTIGATSGLMAGTYTFTATDANGCSKTATATINAAPSMIMISATATQPLCNGGTGSIALSTSGGTGTITTTPATTTGLMAGTYTFTATDANGCSNTATATINAAPSMIMISATATQPLCAGNTGSVVLSATGGTGTLTIPGTTTGLSAGTYTFTATDGNGCTKTTTVVITAPATLVATVSANSMAIASGGSLTLTTTPAGLSNYSIAGPGITNSSASNIFTTTVVNANSGAYVITVTNANGCTASTTINISVFSGSRLALKTMLAGPFDAATGMMWDSLRVKGLIPSTEPYSAAPYTSTYTHVNGGGSETVAPSVLAVSGSNAIVDWVFIQLRNKLDSNVVLATRSALIQRDGDVVDVDGVSPVLFANSAPDLYFVSVEHRNHLGVMTKGKVALTAAGTPLDISTTAVPLFTFAGRGGNPSPMSGAARMIGSVRALYAGNCNVDLAATAYRFVTYNNTTASDRYSLLFATGGTSTITGYNILDLDLNGYARFNGLNPDRLIMLQNTANSNTIIVNEQTPN
jgi:GEVED domain